MTAELAEPTPLPAKKRRAPATVRKDRLGPRRCAREHTPDEQIKVDVLPSQQRFIAAALEARGMSPADLSRMTGISRATCYRVVQGEVRRVRGDYMATILAALGFDEAQVEAFGEARYDGTLLVVKLDRLTLARLTSALNGVVARPPGRLFTQADARKLLHEIGV